MQMQRGRSGVWAASRLPGVSRLRSPSGRAMTARSPHSPLLGREGGIGPAMPPGRKGGIGPETKAGTGPGRRAGIGPVTQEAVRWIVTAAPVVRGRGVTQRGGARGRSGLVTAAAVSGTLGVVTGTETLAVTGRRSVSAGIRGAGAQLLRSCLRATTEAAGKLSQLLRMWSAGRRVAAGKPPLR